MYVMPVDKTGDEVTLSVRLTVCMCNTMTDINKYVQHSTAFNQATPLTWSRVLLA